MFAFDATALPRHQSNTLQKQKKENPFSKDKLEN